jgi:hypothetical protein
MRPWCLSARSAHATKPRAVHSHAALAPICECARRSHRSMHEAVRHSVENPYQCAMRDIALTFGLSDTNVLQELDKLGM